MKIVDLDIKYIDYLRQNDKIVLKNDGKNYTKERKYLGIIITKSNFQYFIPFSSPNIKDDYIDGKIRKSSMVCIRMVDDGQNKLLGTLKLNSMIPIANNNVIKEYNLKAEKDIFYRTLVEKELKYIKKHKNEITKAATKLYNLKINGKNLPMLNHVCDFKLLEEKALEYKLKNEKQQEKEDSKTRTQKIEIEKIEKLKVENER